MTLTGTGFGATQGIGQVNFYYDGNDTIQGPVTSWSDTQIVCTVPVATVNGYPASSGSGPVSVLDGSSNLGPGYDGFSVPFGYGGTKWSGLGMTYRVDPNTPDTAGEEALVDAGASTWNGDSKFAFTDGGLCSTTAKALDGHNDILWGTGLPSGVLAQATYWYSGSTLTEADIEFNDDYTWSDGTSGSYDIQSIATHELGHTLNLRDLYGPRDTSKVMYGYGSSGVQKRSLDPGDAAGIAWIYGVFVPMSGTMVVNGDAAYTKSTAVTLASAIVGATQMRFRNQGDAWPAWQSYSATKSWTLAAGADGPRTVEAQYEDASANVYAQSDSITLDATAPTTGQSGGGPAWRKVDTTVTFSPTDGGSGMSGGSAKTEYSTNGGTTWTTGASLTITADATGHTTDGVHTISYRSTDAIGNLEATKTTTVNMDTAPPVTAQTGGGSTWHNADTTVTFTPTDGGSGMSGGSAGTWYSTDGGAHWTAGTSATVHVDAVGHTADGVHTISYYSTDAIGNAETTRSTTVNVDTQAPTTGVSGADALWHKTDVGLTLTPVDAGPAGMSGGPAKTEYSTNGGASWSTGTSVTVHADAALHSTDGSNTVTWRSTDAAGNTETPAPTATVLIDTTAPATTPSGADAAWHDSDVSVTFSALDAGSGMSGGLARTEYSTDGGAHWTTGTVATVAADPVGHTTDGVTIISYRSTDSIGNVASAQTCEARIDTLPPDTAVSTIPSRASGWYGRDVTITLTPHDAGAGMSGGPALTAYSTDAGLTWTPGSSLTVAADTATHALDGPHAVEYYSIDALGHTETAKTPDRQPRHRAPDHQSPGRGQRQARQGGEPQVPRRGPGPERRQRDGDDQAARPPQQARGHPASRRQDGRPADHLPGEVPLQAGQGPLQVHGLRRRCGRQPAAAGGEPHADRALRGPGIGGLACRSGGRG